MDFSALIRERLRSFEEGLTVLLVDVRRAVLLEAIQHCEGQRWGGPTPEVAERDSEYRRGQWRGANDCVLVLTGLRESLPGAGCYFRPGEPPPDAGPDLTVTLGSWSDYKEPLAVALLGKPTDKWGRHVHYVDAVKLKAAETERDEWRRKYELLTKITGRKVEAE